MSRGAGAAPPPLPRGTRVEVVAERVAHGAHEGVGRAGVHLPEPVGRDPPLASARLLAHPAPPAQARDVDVARQVAGQRRRVDDDGPVARRRRDGGHGVGAGPAVARHADVVEGVGDEQAALDLLDATGPVAVEARGAVGVDGVADPRAPRQPVAVTGDGDDVDRLLQRNSVDLLETTEAGQLLAQDLGLEPALRGRRCVLPVAAAAAAGPRVRARRLDPVGRRHQHADGVAAQEAPALALAGDLDLDRLPRQRVPDEHDPALVPGDDVPPVRDALDPRPGEHLLDLYSGVGLFAGCLAPALGEEGQVDAVESSARACADARRNLHDLPGVRIHERSVASWLRWSELDSVDLVVLDPPRSGAGAEVLDRVLDLAPRAIAYVACDPAALGRDLGLVRSAGWRVASVQGFDLFPMTHHLEAVALVLPPA